MRVIFRPLTVWPEATTRQRQRARFDTGYEATKELLERECRQLGAREVIIQVDIPEADIRLDGSCPKASARAGHPGVVVSFDSKHGPLRYSTDAFTSWQDNLRAIALGLDSLRRVDRYGISKGGEQYTGWRAIGSGSPTALGGAMTVEEAARLLWDAADLGEAPDVAHIDTEALTGAYRRAAKRHHPDAGGDEAAFVRLGEARDLLAGAPL